MKFDPRIHHRRSIRLKGYDYRQAGGYFVTLVTQGREMMFGEVVNGEMTLNPAGEMAVRWWLELSNKFPNAPLSQMIQWYKTMTTNEYIRGVKQLGWKPFNGKLWQRNYYEHVIRNETDFNRITRYIESNPARWADDNEKPSRQPKN